KLALLDHILALQPEAEAAAPAALEQDAHLGRLWDRLPRHECVSAPPHAERPSSAAGPAGKKSCHEKPFCRPRLLQRLVRPCYSSGIESRPPCFLSTFSSRDIICPFWGRTPLCAARGLAFHDVVHPLDQRPCDGPDPARRHLVHHVGDGHAA